MHENAISVLEQNLVANGDFNENPIPSDCADSSITYAYLCPTSWLCSPFVEECTGDGEGGIVIVSSSDTAWGGGGSPSGDYYLSIQATESVNAYINQTFACWGITVFLFTLEAVQVMLWPLKTFISGKRCY